MRSSATGAAFADSFTFRWVWAYVALMRPSRAEGAHSRAWRTLQTEWPRLRAQPERAHPARSAGANPLRGFAPAGENHQVLAHG